MQNRLTIKDIARLSGVGRPVVSRVLNDKSGVSRRTHEHIEVVMQQHGSSPSRSACAMHDQGDKVVAIIVIRLDSLLENLAMQTMLSAFYGQGYGPIMVENRFSLELVEKHLGTLAWCDIGGVALFGFTGIDEAMFAPWRGTLVLMARGAPGLASVCCDNEGAITLLIQRFYDRRHRHISFLGVPYSDVTTGEHHHPAYLVLCKKHHLTSTTAPPGLGVKQGYDTVASVPTAEAGALVCATDTPALDANKYLQQQGHAALQLANVGSTPLMKFLHPEVLTVDPGYAEPGRHAARQLIEQIADNVEPRQIVIPATLS